MYHLQVLTPEEIVFDDDITALIAPGSLGYLGVLSNHAPLISSLKAGIVTITGQHHDKYFYKISGGFLEVKNNRATLLVDTIEPTSPVEVNTTI